LIVNHNVSHGKPEAGCSGRTAGLLRLGDDAVDRTAPGRYYLPIGDQICLQPGGKPMPGTNLVGAECLAGSYQEAGAGRNGHGS